MEIPSRRKPGTDTKFPAQFAGNWLSVPVCLTGYDFGIAPHRSSILMRVRTTLNLDDELIRQARELTGIQEKTALIHAALRELISRGAARRLAALGGSMPNFEAGRRRWPVDAG